MNTINWDLSSIYQNYEQVDKDIELIKSLSTQFTTQYQEKLSTLTSQQLNQAIGEFETILEMLGRVMSYVYLEFATDDSNGVTLNKYQTITTQIEEGLIFFELELAKLEEDTLAMHIVYIPKYAFYLESIKKQKKYQLPLPSEKILLKKELTSSSAWSRLFDEYIGKIEFKYNGEIKSEEEILSLLYNKKRAVRKAASISLTKGLKKHSHVLTYIYNMVRADLRIEGEIRGYESPEISRHLDNKITQSSVDSLVVTALNNTDIVADYYKQKAKILGIKKLKDYDRYAPISKSTKKIPFSEAKELVLNAFKNFDEELYTIAKKAFDENWIDVYPKSGKRGGAFSHPTVTKAHPYVLLNYTDGIRDIFTVAHELGHAIHQYLSRQVGYINFDTPLTTSETASVFAEMLLFDYIKDKFPKKELQSIYASKLEDIFATLYRQIIFTTFEREVHENKGELKTEEISTIWMNENKKMFGSSVELTENYSYWWSYIPHFIHTPFYCYAYSYGQLLVLSLYALYKESGEDFIPKYKQFLSSGGSRSPKELISVFGFDIEDSAFWELGIKEVRKLLKEFKNGN